MESKSKADRASVQSVVRLTTQDMRLLMLILRDITNAIAVDDESYKRKFIQCVIEEIRLLGDSIWPQILTPEEQLFANSRSI